MEVNNRRLRVESEATHRSHPHYLSYLYSIHTQAKLGCPWLKLRRCWWERMLSFALTSFTPFSIPSLPSCWLSRRISLTTPLSLSLDRSSSHTLYISSLFSHSIFIHTSRYTDMHSVSVFFQNSSVFIFDIFYDFYSFFFLSLFIFTDKIEFRYIEIYERRIGCYELLCEN